MCVVNLNNYLSLRNCCLNLFILTPKLLGWWHASYRFYKYLFGHSYSTANHFIPNFINILLYMYPKFYKHVHPSPHCLLRPFCFYAELTYLLQLRAPNSCVSPTFILSFLSIQTSSVTNPYCVVMPSFDITLKYLQHPLSTFGITIKFT